MRDIETTFTDANGKSLLSKSAVSQITERLWADYQEFAGRDLSVYRVLYLFLDGIAERLHLGQTREAVLAAWGITDRGEKVLLGQQPGTKEDTHSSREFPARSEGARTQRSTAYHRRWGAGPDPGTGGDGPEEPTAALSGASDA